MSTQSGSKPSGDRVIEILERGQHWVVENRNKIIFFFVAFLISAIVYQNHLDGLESKEIAKWERATELKNVGEMEVFVKTNMDSNAGKFVTIQLIKKELDGGAFIKAEKYASDYINKFPESDNVGLVTMLRAYAYEEQGKTSDAITDYKKVVESTPTLKVTAESALKRLE